MIDERAHDWDRSAASRQLRFLWGASPIEVCAALPPPSGLKQAYSGLIWSYVSFEKRENIYPVLAY